MKMMRSTSTTSTSGVMLMSERMPPLPILRRPSYSLLLRAHADVLRAGVVDLLEDLAHDAVLQRACRRARAPAATSSAPA